MDVGELVKSREFRDAKKRIGDWKARLEKADARAAMSIRDEKAAFFAQMASERPDLYQAFRINDKELSETIHKKLTGKDIIID
ncbi:MAG: hypothetical protein AB1324_08445 [Candidatus Micrarchaeota archaeon]